MFPPLDKIQGHSFYDLSMEFRTNKSGYHLKCADSPSKNDYPPCLARDQKPFQKCFQPMV